MVGASSPRFLVSLPVEWSEAETSFEQDLKRAQAQIHALLQERFVGRLLPVWPPHCEQIRFYWGKSNSGVQYLCCDVCYPLAFSPTSPEPLMPSLEHRRQYQADMRLKQEAYTEKYIVPFEKRLNAASGEEGVTMGMLNRLLGMDPYRNADASLWFDSPEALVDRLRALLNQGKVSYFRREALLEGNLPAPAKSSPGPRF